MNTALAVGSISLAVVLSIIFFPGVRSASIASFARIFCYRFDAFMLNNITMKILSLSGNDDTSGMFTCGFAAIAVRKNETEDMPASEQDAVQEIFMDHPDGPHKFMWIPGVGWNITQIMGKLSVVRIRILRSDTHVGQTEVTMEIYSPFWRDRRPIEGLIMKILNSMKPDPISRENIHVYSTADGEWCFDGEIQPREPKTVVLPAGMMTDIIDDIKTFENEREWYLEMGIPYSRGYLLTGPPGNGKSTIIRAIASELDRDVRYIDLSRDGVPGDAALRRLVRRTDDDDILVLEDVDCFFSGRKPANGVDVTFTGLLNVIDGLQAPPGRIVFVTTNNRNALDPALMRPGRLDVDIEILPPMRNEIRDMYLRFFPDQKTQAEQFADDRDGVGICMAEIEGQLICHALGNKSIRWSTAGYRVSESKPIQAFDADVCAKSGKP